LLLVPLHTSGASHGPAAGRQTAPAGLSPSFGQSPLVPVQNSAASHGAVDGRHTVVAGLKASAGHVAAVPVQNSATSQEPVAPRHWNDDGLKPSAGHLGLEPVQNSATSHGPAAGRHIVVDDSSLHFEEQQSPSSRLPSSHSSPGSSTPLPQHAPAIVASTMCMIVSERCTWLVSLMLPSVPPMSAMTLE